MKVRSQEQTRPYVRRGRPLSAVDQWYGRQLASRVGPVAAARALGMQPGTFALAVIGAPVFASTEDAFRSARLEDSAA
jgi:hypothetical protein